MFRKLTIALSFVIAGLVAGIVLTGRMRSDEVAVAQPTGPSADSVDAQAATTALAAPGPDFTRVASQTVRAVANISAINVVRQRTSPYFSDPFFQQFFGDPNGMFGSRDRYASSLGSGVVVSANGYVVTNNHVLGQGTVQVTVSLADKRELKAKVVGVDTWTDLALLKVEATNLPVIPWGDSSRLKVAEWVMAIGNPYQLSQSVSLGIVSALGRSNVGISTYEDFIQTDAAINPGNSGGALVSARGELIGINTAIFTQSGGYQGIGFAVPSNLVRHIVEELTQYGEVRRGSIGYLEVAPMTTHIAEQLGAPSAEGVVVTDMRQGAASRAGIEPYDIIVTVNGQRINDTATLLKTISDAPIGSTATIEVVREGARRTFKVPVERQGQRSPRPRRG
jgi:Do/DeqQ family serine protease